MRQLLVWLACFGVLFPADLGVHILQTPVMWAHYQEYLQSHEDIGFTDFLDIHTSMEAHEQSDHDKQESEFPCHHHHEMVHVSSGVLVFLDSEFILELPSFCSDNRMEFAEIKPDIHSNSLDQIWNPPRFV
ncbi:MAG: hypothetical protein GC180_08605 [Bacteroidetes bacterium]|nr:hypothetical protein [Bacteroidota bacterium]